MTEEQIQRFWQNPSANSDYLLLRDSEYLALDDQFRIHYRDIYRACPPFLRRLNAIPLEGKRVLEIGIADGTNSERLIRRGAIWSGIDPDEEAVERVTKRLHIRRLPYEALNSGHPAAMLHESESFDVVFSHAFLSSIPDIGYVQQEIARVLKPGGDLIAVLYARWSLHWLLSRLAQLAGSTQNAAREFVYDSRKVRRTFRSFHLNSASKMFLDYGLPGESLFGWWIWAHLQSRTPPASS